MRILLSVTCLLGLILCSNVKAENSSVDDPLTVSPVYQKSAGVINECGTQITPEQAAAELAREAQGWPTMRSPSAATLYVPMVIHIVRRSDGTGGFSIAQVYEAINDLNLYYQPLNLQFFSLRNSSGEYQIDYIDNDEYFAGISDNQEMADLKNENPVENVINTWFVPNFIYCGVSSYTTSGSQGIIMNNLCTGPTSRTTWAHEVGHYFDLYHTHESYYGVECPDGSNCDNAGDKLCDTPADPNLYGLVDYYCNYTGSTSPPLGCSGTYDPPIENIMSYSRKNCRTEFSGQQVSKMMNVMLLARANLFQYDFTDSDGDGVPDIADNCPDIANSEQLDADSDPYGDLCDNCPNDYINDADGDGLCTVDDSCPNDPLNDSDGDGYCADADVCPGLYNPDQLDTDGDGVGDLCDDCPLDPANDIDHDGYCADTDICPDDYNPNQLDADADGIGDLCDNCPLDHDNDIDQDGYCATEDNCPNTYNPDQADSNQDNIGDLCCCGASVSGQTGNTDCSSDGKRNLADISRMIDYVYISKQPLCCMGNGNTDGDEFNKTNLADISRLIDHVYISSAETAVCQ